MKIGFSTFACPEWHLKDILRHAMVNGYQGVEFRIDAHHNHGVDVYASQTDRREIRSRLSDEGLEPYCLATSLLFASDRVMDDVPARIELATDIGCPALRVLCGPTPEGLKMPDVIDKVGKQLHIAAELADQAAIQLWLETHDTLSTGTNAAAAVRVADHPVVGVCYDNIHPFRMGEPLELTVAALNGLVRHCHFHDALNKPDQVVIRPIGQGHMPMDEMFEALFKMGFDGYLSGEWFHDQYGDTPEGSIQRYYTDITGIAQLHGVNLQVH